MKAKKVYYILRSVMGLSFHMMFTVSVLYRIDIANLEAYQLILLGSALEISLLLFEVPTGIIADLKSRRLSVIIGLFIIGLGFIMEAFTTWFIIIFLSQIVWGFGYTFISGALDSWISDETHNVDIQKTLVSGQQMNKLFSFAGIVIAGIIGTCSIILGIYVAGSIFMMLGVFAITCMREEHFQKTVHQQPLYKEYFSQLIEGFKHVKKNNILRLMFVAMLFYGLFSEGIDRTYELFILDHLGFRGFNDWEPIWVIASVNGIIAITSFVFLEVIKRFVKKERHFAMWVAYLTGMMIMGLLLFAYLPYLYFALFGYIFFTVMREGSEPILNAILITNTPSKIKATVLSGFGQLDAIGQLISGGLMVALSILTGIKGMYLVAALLLIIPIISLLSISKIKK